MPGPAAERALLLWGVLAAATALGIAPEADRTTWFLENAPVFLGAGLIVAFRGRFLFSNFTLRLMAVHAAVLMVGGHYTYAKVPAGFWVQELLELDRNPYDRLGHFFQGFVPALMVREFLLRRSPLRRGTMLCWLTLSACLAVSALYELAEWLAALVLGQGADEFLGTQGDPWDTQWDMFLALAGAACAYGLLGSAQDRALERLGEGAAGPVPLNTLPPGR